MADPDIVARLRGFWLPNDTMSVIRDEAADEIERLRAERDEARRLYCRAVEEIEHGMTNETERMVADYLGWDCFNTPEGKVDRTLNGVIVDGGKAVPPKYEDLDNE